MSHLHSQKYRNFREALIKSHLNVVRCFDKLSTGRAHHERNHQITVRPEPVEGLNQKFPNIGAALQAFLPETASLARTLPLCLCS